MAARQTFTPSTAHEKDQQPKSTGVGIHFANGLSRSAFYKLYVESFIQSFVNPNNVFIFETASDISMHDFQACFDLIEFTSAAAYKTSSKGWCPVEKRREMCDPRMRYILLRDDCGLVSFLSFMLDYEGGYQVVYCYEVHVRQASQGQGYGTRLLKLMEDIGRAVGVKQAMLTVFVTNNSAIRLYRRLGYEKFDEEPLPPARRLRSRTTYKPQPSYIIMSKKLT